MCGIAAIITPRPDPALASRAGRMLDLIAHRGPDDRGVEVFDDRVALASNRLAIQDRSPAGHQPMLDPSGRFWLIFNGEIYNFVELREKLVAAGETFTSSGDTEVLLRLLARDGVDALPRLDGMFALIVYDLERRRLVAVRDRFGIKPFYLWRSPEGALHVASEIKAFTEAPGWSPALNGMRARDYLVRGLIDHTDETLFDGVTQLPAGHWVTIDPACLDRPLEPKRWYTILPAAPLAGRAPGPERVRELLATSVSRRLRADVTVGSCLSGGIDSSSIVCLAAEALTGLGASEGQKTFTARSDDAAIDEGAWAQAVAESAGVEAVHVRVDGAAMLAALGDLVWTQDEPFTSPSIFAQHQVFAAAREHGVTVMLDGQGADEQLAGYHAFFRVHLWSLLRTFRLSRAVAAARAIRWTHRQGFALQLARAMGAAAPAWILDVLAPRPFVDRLLDVDAIAPGWSDPFHRMSGRRRGLRAFSLDQLERGSLPMLLHWEDRNSMAHGVEARVPFLAPDLVAHVVGLPDEAKLDGARTKAVLRDAMAGLVPRPVLARTDKVAFETPEAFWFCEAHRSAARAALDDALTACGPLVMPGAADTLVEMLEGRRPYDRALWRVMCFGAWLRRFSIVP